MKRQTGKRLLSLFLSFVMILGMFPASVLAADDLGSVQVIVENTTYLKEAGAAWDGTLVDTTVDLAEDSTMMSCIGEALSDYDVEGLSDGYITSIHGLAAFDGGSGSGWMGTLNDWFTDAGFDDFNVANGELCDGDVIRVMYTCNLGADLDGAYDTNEGWLSSLSAREGTLEPAFAKATLEYKLTVDADVETVAITAAAENKQDKVTVKVGETAYRRGVNVPVADGTVISIACGKKTYTVTVAQEAAAPDTYVVTLSTGDGYTVEAAEDSSSPVAAGGSFSFTVTIAEGYEATTDFAVKANDVALTETDGVYTIENITEAQTVTVEGVAEVHTVEIVDLPSDWPSFRGNAQNNGVTDARTPIAADSTELVWAEKQSTGWSDAPSPMILVDGDVITMCGSTLKKLNASDGSVKASTAMAAATNWGSVPPTYGDGILFCPLDGGKVQAFSAKTLESLWVYTDEKGGQSQSPITYDGGYVYVGFGYGKEYAFVCLDAETGAVKWRVLDSKGFYWAGAVVVGNYVIVGNDAGHLVSRDKLTGEEKSDLDCSAAGAIRSSICYAEGKVWFAGYNAKLCWAELNEDGTLGALNTVDCSAYGQNSTGTPVVYDGLAYLGVGGWSGSKNVVCVDPSTKTVKWNVEEPAYPQCSILLSTAYKDSGYLYLYVTYNNNPGGVNVIKAKTDGSEATQETLYIPDSDAQQFCICSVIADADGTLYYKNDSGNIFALKAVEPETIPVTLSGLHSAQVNAFKLYTYTDGEKGETDLLADVAASDGAYTVDLEAGDYWVDGYDANGDLNGGLKLTVSEESSSFKVQRMYQIYATNGGWVKGTDYTIDVTVTDADGNARAIEPGQGTSWGTTYTTCLFVVGDTVQADFTPIGERAADYLPATAKKTPTLNNSLSASIPQAYEITITAPAGSTIAAGTFGTYYIYTFADPTVTEDENDVTAVFRVPQTNANHFYRVQHPNGVTYWNFTKWNGSATVNVTENDLYLGSSEFTSDTVYRFDKNVYDMANIYLNANSKGYLDLDVGERFEFNVFRNWMAIESTSNAKVGLPDMHYTVIDPEGRLSDILTITPDENNSSVATMTANEEGTAIVLVTYDAMTNVPAMGGKQFSAIWPECTGVVVVTVGADGSSIETNMMMDRLDSATTALDAEHDFLFYLGDEGASYSFKPESGCTVTVNRSIVSDKMTFGGFTREGVTVADDGTVTVSGLTTGRHIIKVEKDGLATYQVVTARGVSYELQDADGNPLAEDAEIHAGDTIKVQFTGLLSPAEKLSGVYNFNFSLYYFGEDGTSFRSAPGGSFGVYDFSGNPVRQNITITIPKYWDGDSYTLHGAIKLGGFAAAPLGGHRDVTYAEGKPVSFDATSAGMILSRLPELTIALAETEFVDGKLTFVDSAGRAVARTALTVNLTDSAGNKIIVADDGSFPCVAGEYTYTIYGAGYRYKTGSFSIGEDETAVGKRIKLENSPENAWDGVTETEPQQDENDVYLISTGAELAWFSAQNQKNTQNISGKLTADIDLADYPWNNTLSSASKATVLDGDGHTVSGLNAARGLFGALGSGSAVKKLTIRGTLSGGGAVTGYARGAVIENCVNEAVINGTGSNVGGIAGYAADTTIRNCVNRAAVTGGSSVGGIIGGFAGATTVTRCYNTGAVTGTSNVGGIFGSSGYAITVDSCYNTGAVTGTSNVGGVGGQLTGPSYGSGTSALTDCYSVGTVTGESSVGGLLGSFGSDKASVTRGYYLNTKAESDPAAEALDETAMKNADLNPETFAPTCSGYPALRWQTDVTFHAQGAQQSVVPATCTEKGYTTYLCTACRESFRKEFIAPLGHDFCEHEGVPENCTDCVYTAPGCETEGSIVHTCCRDGCAVTKTDVIPATDHTPLESSIRTFPAYRTYTCAVCGQENIVKWNDPRLAHVTLRGDGISDVTMADGDYPWAWNADAERFESTNVGVNSSTSQTSLTVTLTAEGTISFGYGVSSEANYDKLTISLGEEKIADGISGSNTGSFERTLEAGTYTFTFAFAKDSSSASGTDRAWFEEFTIETETAAQPDPDQEAADAVEALIDAIGTPVTLESADAIDAARAAYDALTDTQKALVENYAELIAAEAALAALEEAKLASLREIYNKTAQTLLATDVTTGSKRGEWMMFGLARAEKTIPEGKLTAYYAALDAHLEANYNAETGKLHQYKPTENERIALALRALGDDPAAYKGMDLMRALTDTAWVTGQGNNSTAFALLAIRAAGYDAANESALVQSLLDKQLENGGWNITTGAADCDATAMAVQALAPYYQTSTAAAGDSNAVKTAVDKALAYLAGLMNDAGQIQPQNLTASAENTAQVIVALTELGRDPAADAQFTKNGKTLLDGLTAFYVEGDQNGFKHSADGGFNQMATEQSFYALASYFRLKAEKTSLYDMSDVAVSHAITVSAEHGTVTPSAAKAVAGAEITVTVAPDAGYELVSLTMNRTTLTVTEGTARFTMPDADVTLAAVFRLTDDPVGAAVEAIDGLNVVKANRATMNALEAAEALYDALTEEQKAQVANADKLTAARTRYDALLGKAIDKALDDLKDEFSDYDEDDYTASNWKKLKAAYDDGRTAIRKAACTEDIDKALTRAIDAMEDIPVLKDAIEVTFRLIGDSRHADGVQGHDEYVTWIKTTTYEMSKGDTVYDVFLEAIDDHNLKQKGAANNYVSAIRAPSVLGGYWLFEFDNGKNSGWMYTVNGKHPDVGLQDYKLRDGDEIIWHYVDDYTLEERSSSSRYYERWLEARDITPEKYAASLEEEQKPGDQQGNMGTIELPSGGQEEIRFLDVGAKDWYYDDVQYVAQNGLFSGVGGDRFAPQAEMSRAMVVSVLHRLAGSPVTVGGTAYSDAAPGLWYTDAVRWASLNGIAVGYGNGRFGANEAVTREQFAVMLYQFAVHMGYAVDVQADLSRFADAQSVSGYAQTAVRWAVDRGILSGYNGMLAPRSTASRAEIASMMHRFVENVVK